MEIAQNLRSAFRKKADADPTEDAAGESQKWAVTLTGKSVKGLKPVTIVVEAPTGKAACAALKVLFLNHKLSVEKA